MQRAISLYVSLVLLGAGPAAAQTGSSTLVVRVRHGAAPVAGAEVTAGELTVHTDATGSAELTLPAGEHEISILRSGFAPAILRITLSPEEETVQIVQLREQRLEDQVTVIAATRGGTILEDEPLRVEAVPQEEIEENLTIAPGNLTTLLNELGGLRVQTTTPTLGGAQIRLQGLRGRYTRILTDELPLQGTGPDPFGVLQVPPLDLAQVEVIKGTATALYGGSALGGVVNLVSRRPDGEPEALVNQTSHQGTDIVGFVPGRLRGHWGYTLLGSGHWQHPRDLDGDDWADLPGYRRAVLRPRFYWDDQGGRSFFATVGGTAEDRQGGTVDGGKTPAGSSYRETLETRRFDGGIVGRFLVGGDKLVSVHASLENTLRDRRLGSTEESDERESSFAEVSLEGNLAGHTWILGTAVEHESLAVQDLGNLDYSHTVPAVFAQDTYALSEKVSAAGSVRVDSHNVYGTFFSPRVSLLVRPVKVFSIRASAGTGYAAPVPLTERIDEVGFSRLMPLEDIEPERARSASLDLSWTRGGLEVNGTLFASRVDRALVTQEPPAMPGTLEIVNAPDPTRTQGSELLVHYTRGALHGIVSYTYLHSSEFDPAGGGRREVPLNPRGSGEVAVILEDEDRGRIGAELSYTGKQNLEENPYRSAGASYWEISVLGELRLGGTAVFLNAVNLTDVRQSHYDPLLLPARSSDGRWTTDVWAPLEGRVINAGVRLEF